MLYTLTAKMALFRRTHADASASVIALLLFVLLLTYNLKLTLASSGGVMGGSFFDENSSSSSDSYSTSDSNTYYTQTTPYYARMKPDYARTTPYYDRTKPDYTPPDAEVASESHGGLFDLFLVGSVLCLAFGFVMFASCEGNHGISVTVLKLQVAMLGGKGSTIQRDLTRIAETADTSSRQGVSHLLTEIIQSLLQNFGQCVGGYLSVDQKRSKEEGEKCYNHLSKEERAKFDEETLVNLNGKQKRNIRIQIDDVFGNEYTKGVKENMKEQQKFEEKKLLSRFDDEYIVVTILVAVKGAHKLPNINGAEDLKKALQDLRSLLSTKLLAGEVLWTPQNEDDTPLSNRKLLEDYPQLANCMNHIFS